MKINYKKLLVCSISLLLVTSGFGRNYNSNSNQPNLRLTKNKLMADNGGRTDPHSVVKLNVTQLALKNISLQYEYAFHKNFTASLGFSDFLKRSTPGLFVDDDPTGEGLRNPTFKGFAITPEIRFYPGRKEERQAPHGFYLAAYLRYAKYTMNSEYYDVYNGQTYGYDLSAHYKGASGGLMIGYQWIIAKHFSIDFWIIGGGFGKAKFDMKANAVGTTLSPGEQASVRDAVADQLSDASYLNASAPVIETTDHSVSAKMGHLPMLSVRGAGLCFGFAF